MKKVFLLIAVLTLSISTIGCSASSSKSDMQIEPAKLTEQESHIVKLIQSVNPSAIFDYTINSEIKSVSITSYKLDKNGKWLVNIGPCNFPLKNSTGRIAISFDILVNGLRVAIQEGDSITSNETKSGEKIDTKDMGNAISFASAEIIEGEKEIPLVIQMFTPKKEFQSYGVEFFNNPEEYLKRGYEDVYVVAIKFSKNELK